MSALVARELSGFDGPQRRGPVRRKELLQEVRKMCFVEVYGGWKERRLTQEEAARMLGVSERTFRRQIDRYEEAGLDGLLDGRLSQPSHRRAPVDEVLVQLEHYKQRNLGWNAKHFYAWYRKDGGTGSYTWVKCRLQKARLIAKAPGCGKHRKSRERAAWRGIMLHQDGSKHEWVPRVQWDLILTMDDATNGHYSLFLVEEERTVSSFQDVKEVLETRGLFSSLYTDRGSHYWTPPEAGAKLTR